MRTFIKGFSFRPCTSLSNIVFADSLSAALLYSKCVSPKTTTFSSSFSRVVVVSDVQALQCFLDKLTQLPGIANVRSSFALKAVRYETALPVRTAST